MEELRRNKVFKSLHKPLTFLGIERRLFTFVIAGAIATFNLTNSMLATLVVFTSVAGFAYWATQKDPAFLTILFKADRLKSRYDAAKQQVPNVEIR